MHKTPKTTVTGDSKEKEASKSATDEVKLKQIHERSKVLEDHKKTIEVNKKTPEDKRKQILEQNEGKNTGTISEGTIKEEVKTGSKSIEPAKEVTQISVEEAKQKQAEQKAKILDNRKKMIEERKKALEEKRKKMIEEREASKKTKDTLKTIKENTNN